MEPGPRKLVWSHFIFAFLAAGIPVLVIYVSGVKPRNRPFFIFDARISYEEKPSTFTAPVCIAVSAGLALIQVLLSEFYLVTSPDGWWRTLQAALNLVAAFAYQIFIQQLSAYVSGKPRPDFITTCKPDMEAYSAGLLRDAPVKDYALYTSVCTTDADIKDHLKSFPSGHASSTACITFFGMIYFTYTYYCRRKLGKYEMREPTFWRRFWGDLRLGLMGFFMFVQLFWVWMVGVSRYTDNKHGVDDVNSGWYLGTIFAAWGVWETFAFEHRQALLDRSLAAQGPSALPSAQRNNVDGHVNGVFSDRANAIDPGKPEVAGGASAGAAELGEVKHHGIQPVTS